MLNLPQKDTLESPQVLKELIPAHQYLAELKGLLQIIPNEKILLTNLALQEAKDSSAIENIITTQDSLYKHQVSPEPQNTANKEVYNYSKALKLGHEKVKSNKGLSCNTILEIQKIIEPKRPGFRTVPGTVLKNMAVNEIIYTPPSPEKIPKLMRKLEHLINTNSMSMDPIIKMAIVHHWFESIHPFYDGNGRTGRIINILCLILNELLEHPVLYLSRYIQNNKSDYYRLLTQVREENTWKDWILYMVKGVAVISRKTTYLIKNINDLFKEYKIIVRSNHKFYSHDLINNIFSFPYTKIKFLEKDMNISRATATRYLDALANNQLLEKKRIGRESYYINRKLFDLLKNS